MEATDSIEGSVAPLVPPVGAGWPPNLRSFPRERGLHQLVEVQAARTPDAPALVFEAETLTYSALEVAADELAAELMARGVKPDGLVGLAVERGPQLIVAVLATLKAGAACVPFALDYPEERLRRMLEDARPELLLTSAAATRKLSGAGGSCLSLDDVPVRAGRRASPGWQHPEQRAYVLFTSGSTGRPKGVAMPHRALVNLVHWQCAESACGVGDRTLQFAALSFDVSFQEIFATLASGGTLVLIPETTRRDLVALAGLIRAERVARLYLPFAVLDDLSGLLLRGDPAGLALREVIVAGEQLRITPAVRELFTRLPQARLVNHYGPTETHVATTFTLTGPASEWPALPPIGRPVPNTVVHVLDERGHPVPLGEPGELFIGGVQVADGYLHRPELTAERFVTNPLADGLGGRLYRTGDGGRWRADGVLEYLGRLDDQVKVRGFRIELGEIESVLSEAPGVGQAAVVAQEEATGEKRLGACVVPRPGEAFDPAAALTLLRSRLPDYMVPAGVACLDAIPLSPNGKIDRRRLAATRFAPWKNGTQPLVRPGTPLEQLIERIWCGLLGRTEVGIDEDFFAIGGHSLLAMRAAARVGEARGREVPLRWMFEARTARALARRLEEAGGAVRPTITPVTREGRLPLSGEQERLWFIQQLMPEWCAYNVPLAIRRRGPWPGEAVQRALSVLEARHEMLRTTFPSAAGEPFLRIEPAGGLRLAEEDLRTVPAADREARLCDRLREEARRPFDLAAAPPVCVRLFVLGAEDHVLFFNLHHILCDEWSLRLLLEELEALVAVDGDAGRAGLAALPVQYADYAVWQHGATEWAAGEAHQAFWERTLAGAPEGLGLPRDRPRPRSRSGGGRTWEAHLPAALVRAVEAVGRAAGASAFVTWLALFRALLTRVAGRSDLVIGTPFSLRQQTELQGVLGFFLNLLPMRAPGTPERTFVEALRQEHETALAAFDHGGVSFARMVRMESGRGVEQAGRLIPTLFVFVEQGVVPARWLNGSAEEIRVDTGTAKFELMLSMERRADGTLSCAWEFSTDVYEAATIERTQAQFEALARQVAARPGVPLAQLEFPVMPGGPPTAERADAGVPAIEAPGKVAEVEPGLATPAEQALAGLWRGLLGVTEVGPADDFFALGGHSLLAVRLVNAILREFGVLLPLSVMLASPALRAMAREIELRRQPGPALPEVADALAEPRRAPFFLVGWMIQPEGFFQSAEALYVLPLPELGDEASGWRIERLAEACLSMLRAARPHGPYLLGGYSAAGIVAYAMACRLRAEGEEVSLLALIDSIPMVPWLGRLVRGVGRVGAALGMSDARQLFWGRLAIWLGDDLILARRLGRGPGRKVWRKVRQRIRGAGDGTGTAPEGRFWRHLWAMAHYEPARYDGELTLLISAETRRGIARPDGGWSRWANRVQEVSLPGNHMTCVHEHRAELAARLQALCDAARTASAPTSPPDRSP